MGKRNFVDVYFVSVGLVPCWMIMDLNITMFLWRQLSTPQIVMDWGRGKTFLFLKEISQATPTLTLFKTGRMLLR